MKKEDLQKWKVKKDKYTPLYTPGLPRQRWQQEEMASSSSRAAVMQTHLSPKKEKSEQEFLP